MSSGSGIVVGQHSVDTAAAVRTYLRYMKLECNYSANTIEAYSHDLSLFTDFLASEGLNLASVRLEDMERFAVGLHGRGIGPRSQSRVLSGVRTFFRYLIIDGFVDEDPTELLEWPRLPVHLPSVLTTGEVDAMEAAALTGKWEGQRNRAIIEVLFSCGLRVSELVGLKFSDVDLVERFMRIRGKGRKERLVPVSGSAVTELERWIADRERMKTIKPGEEDYVFLNRRGAHLTRTMILIMIKDCALRAGIAKTVSPHTLRHSFATALLKGGADLRVIQDLLGHEDIETTEIYTHIDADDLRRAVLEHHPRNIRCSGDEAGEAARQDDAAHA